MARVTVEDCVDKMPNRFELVLVAAHRARALAAGTAITIERENHFGLVQTVIQHHGKGVGAAQRGAPRLEIHRFIDEPLRGGKLLADQRLQTRARRRAALTH